MTPNPDSRPVLSVSQLGRQARQLLEDCFPAVWVEGEISGLSIPSSGHWYFTLKDEAAQVSCAMFKRQAIRVRSPVENGMKVLLRAKISLYEPRGQFQLIVEHLEEAGLGALQRATEMLKARLQAEGLFEPGRKRPLPALPHHIGVVTSPTGAAIHDILTVLRRRFPAIRVTVFPVLVQGESAPAQITAAIERANRWAERLEPPLDLLVVGRGGGSLEDLQAFNTEGVARAIVASRLPVVSAVGHEVDVTIADFVADVRAATPSAAAELLSPDQEEWRSMIHYRCSRMERLLRTRLERARQQTDWLAKRLRHPGEILDEQRLQLAQHYRRLHRSLQQRLQQERSGVAGLALHLKGLNPAAKLPHWRKALQVQQQALLRAWQNRQRQRRLQLAGQSQLLDSLSPLATLGRGYAIARDARGHILRHIDTVKPGDAISTQLANGILHSTVNRIDSQEE